ncbi:MAG TPA: hypothetical protein VLL77_08190 [Anaerolineales bacterium]|nr:hypothetical protein [Anaerolineales bacterium]
MRPDDRRWCLIFGAIMIVLTSIPYLLGFQTQGTEWRFTGFVFGVGDGNSYIAKMFQGSDGAWLFQTPYASHVGSSLLAFLPYLLLGKLAAGPDLHVQLVALYHLARVLFIPLAVLAIFQFASMFLEERAWRRWATIVVVAGGGLGWLLVLIGPSSVLGSLPLDLYSPEAFGFLSFYGLPHLLLARILLLLGLAAYLRAAGWRNGILSGAIFFVLGLVQPLTIISAYAAIGAHIVVLGLGRAFGRAEWRLGPWLRSAVPAVGISLPIIAYYVLGSWIDPSLRSWAGQNVLPSPHPTHYLLAYAVVLIPAGLGTRRSIQTQGAMGWFLPSWVAVLLLLAYAPVAFQRRLVDGAWVALAILAAQGLRSLEFGESRRRIVAGALMGALMLTTAVLIAGGVWTALRPQKPAFRPATEVEAILWLAENVEKKSVVLASFETGNVVPAWAPLRSVMGHGPETPDLGRLRPQIEAFFGESMTVTERQGLLDRQRVDFVFLGPEERALGSWDPVTLTDLLPIYSEGGYDIFAVQRP